MLAANPIAINPPRRRGRPCADRLNPLSAINEDGYEVVGAMANQWGALGDICDANSLEDQARAQLGAILREQERVLTSRRPDVPMALDLCRRALRKLALVDQLDAEQGLDARQPVERAKQENRRAHAAGRRIISASEPRTGNLYPVA